MDSDEIRKLLAEATPGPWATSGKQTVRYIRFNKLFGWICRANWENGSANARLIAAAPDLAAEVLRLRADLAVAMEALDGIANQREPIIPHAARDLCVHGRSLDEECSSCIRAHARAALKEADNARLVRLVEAEDGA